MEKIIPRIEISGNAYRIKKCAYNLLEMMGVMLVDDEDFSWDLMRNDLRLKWTFLYCDFNQLLHHTPLQAGKKLLTDLANRLFYCIQELDYAVKAHSVSLTEDRYNHTALVLQEVMAIMPGENIAIEEDEWS